jgi:hypothetical protein
VIHPVPYGNVGEEAVDVNTAVRGNNFESCLLPHYGSRMSGRAGVLEME